MGLRYSINVQDAFNATEVLEINGMCFTRYWRRGKDNKPYSHDMPLGVQLFEETTCYKINGIIDNQDLVCNLMDAMDIDGIIGLEERMQAWAEKKYMNAPEEDNPADFNKQAEEDYRRVCEKGD